MKKFIIKATLTIIIPVVLFLVAYEFTMRSIPNDYSYKSELWEKKVDKIKVLVLGSSHAYYGFDPAYFNKTAFNAAHVSQSYNYDWFLFNKYFDRMDSLEYVIIPISSFSPYSRIDDGKEAWRCKDYSIYYNCRFHKWYDIKYRYYFAYISGKNILQAKSRLLDCTYNNIHIDSNGYSLKTLEDRIDDIVKDGIIAAERHTVKEMAKKKDLIQQNTDYIKDIITRCQKRGINIILVSTPTLPVYYTHLNSEQIKVMEDFGRQMEQYCNVKYINYLKNQLFDINDFFNSDHLCNNGAKKLTLMINDIINAWEIQGGNNP